MHFAYNPRWARAQQDKGLNIKPKIVFNFILVNSPCHCHINNSSEAHQETAQFRMWSQQVRNKYTVVYHTTVPQTLCIQRKK